jgi:hypothetical protein
MHDEADLNAMLDAMLASERETCFDEALGDYGLRT